MSEQLPEGWVETRLGNYIFVKNGFAFKSSDYCEASNNTIPVLRISDIDGKFVITSGAIHVSLSLNADNFIVEEGDLLIAMSGATTGKIGIFKEKISAYQNQRVGNIKLIAPNLSSFSFRNFLMQFITPEVIKIAYGGAQPNISSKAIEDISIILPPLAEQQEIANRLDALLAQVDVIKARLDAIPAILKRFRQSVLAAAVSGRLYSESIEWENKSLGEIVDSRLGKMLDKQKNQGQPHLYLRNVNVRWFDFDLSDLLEMRVTEDELESLYVNKGDILVCEGGEPGRCAIWNQDSKQYVFQKALHRLRVKECVIPEWVCFILKELADSKKLDEYFTGTTIKHLTGQSLKQIPVPLPSIEEQTEIVRRVEQLFALADHIEQQVQNAQNRVNHLTQSLLTQAFNGELTAQWRQQHPDLISGANSAAQLLANIQSNNTTPKNSTKKQKHSAQGSLL